MKSAFKNNISAKELPNKRLKAQTARKNLYVDLVRAFDKPPDVNNSGILQDSVNNLQLYSTSTNKIQSSIAVNRCIQNSKEFKYVFEYLITQDRTLPQLVRNSQEMFENLHKKSRSPASTGDLTGISTQTIKSLFLKEGIYYSHGTREI